MANLATSNKFLPFEALLLRLAQAHVSASQLTMSVLASGFGEAGFSLIWIYKGE
jgi:hypothetical protein